MTEPFGFRVAAYTGSVVVSLPHQCDRWEIATGPYEQALAELERFIAEACAARDALVRKESMGL